MKLSPHTAFLIFNFLGLQITWAACAYGATNSMPILGVVVGLIYIALHLLLTKVRNQDLLILLTISIIGISVDHINTYLGLMAFTPNNTTHSVIPLWLIILWMVFSLMLPHSLNWLGKNTALSFLIGGLGGASSYWLGHKLSAISISEPLLLNISILFIEWAVICTVAYRILAFIRAKISNKQLITNP
ncbi:MAG: DUF2878 domain-containing protein [Gammaproteobacteria bacterium]